MSDLKTLYIAYEQAKSLRELLGNHSTALLSHDQKIAFDLDYQKAFDTEYEAYCAYRKAIQNVSTRSSDAAEAWLESVNLDTASKLENL